MIRLITLILCIGAIQARIFNNPIFGNGNNYDPGGIKVNGTYYITTRNTNYNHTEKIVIHKSTDLINWEPAGYVFDETNFPFWAIKYYAFWYANIHEIRGNYHVYFTAYNKDNFDIATGVAVAPHPLGPYTATDPPFIVDGFYPTIANDNGNLYMIWMIDANIYGRQLNSNGLSFASNETIELIRPNLTWENTAVFAPWYIRREDYHYIMYTGAGTGCETRGIGVARSRNVLGPYEKLDHPILVSNKEFKDPMYNSGFKDLDDQSDVIVFQTYKESSMCDSDQVLNLASIGWHANSWPYIYDY